MVSGVEPVWDPGTDCARLRFGAMASPCEILFDRAPVEAVRAAGQAALEEVRRIETTYSRYRPDSVVSTLNATAGQTVRVDAETARLLRHADTCHRLSNGLFDITSGVLRQAWDFTRDHPAPDPAEILALMPRVGWHRVRWDEPELQLAPGMEVDFGGIGKEYAVDRALAVASAVWDGAILVNLGGDVAANAERRGGRPWLIGTMDGPRRQRRGVRQRCWPLRAGAIATSGSTRRFKRFGGIRYGHILNPLTGWPVPDPPLSVSVVATNCSEAGLLSTLAMLKGREAEIFLREQGVHFHCMWEEEGRRAA